VSVKEILLKFKAQNFLPCSTPYVISNRDKAAAITIVFLLHGNSWELIFCIFEIWPKFQSLLNKLYFPREKMEVLWKSKKESLHIVTNDGGCYFFYGDFPPMGQLAKWILFSKTDDTGLKPGALPVYSWPGENREKVYLACIQTQLVKASLTIVAKAQTFLCMQNS